MESEDSEPDIKPTLKEVRDWLLSTLRHSCMVEYYLDKIGIPYNAGDRPHDIVGDGNKFSWPVMKGLALQYRSNDPEFFMRHVMPSIEMHRHQFHHQKWNLPFSNANEDELMVGAIDALCSMLDYRKYQGGSHSMHDIPKLIKKSEGGRMRWFWTLEPEHAKWMWIAYNKMKDIPIPNTKLIRSLKNFPNIGIPEETYNIMKSRLKETLNMLRKQGYDI